MPYKIKARLNKNKFLARAQSQGQWGMSPPEVYPSGGLILTPEWNVYMVSKRQLNKLNKEGIADIELIDITKRRSDVDNG